jgi:hypothetical protein
MHARGLQGLSAIFIPRDTGLQARRKPESLFTLADMEVMAGQRLGVGTHEVPEPLTHGQSQHREKEQKADPARDLRIARLVDRPRNNMEEDQIAYD